jgi:hypothetical protein
MVSEQQLFEKRVLRTKCDICVIIKDPKKTHHAES